MPYEITPGCMGVVSIACKCLGVENVNPGGWATPVWVSASKQDAAALLELLNEAGKESSTTFQMKDVPNWPRPLPA